MAACPFCHASIDDHLALHGGTCPQCFADIPGEETATDPGEEVKAQLREQDQAHARRRAMMPVYIGAPVLALGLAVVAWQLWPAPTHAPLDIPEDEFAIDIDLAEYVEPEEPEEEDDAVAQASGGAAAPSGSKGSPSTPVKRPNVKDTPDGTSSGGRSDGPDVAPGGPREIGGPSAGSAGDMGMAGGLSFDTKRTAALLTSRVDMQNAVKDLFRSKSPRLQQCYERSLKGNEALAGQWRLSFTIGKDGAMSDVKATGVDMQDGSLEGCLEREMASWRIYGRLAKPWPVSLPINFSGM